MNYALIARYALLAARTSAAAMAVWIVLRALALAVRRRRIDFRREALYALNVAYLAALTEIIALRGGERSVTIEPKLIPLTTTLGELRRGVEPFLFHTLGNLGWFVPMGLMLCAFRPKAHAVHAFALGAAVSTLLEAYQWIFHSGVPDVDDVLLNAFGALAGYGLRALWLKMRRRRRTSDNNSMPSEKS